MASTDTTSSPQKETDKEIEALGTELGADTSGLAFATPFMPVAVGVRKTPDEELLEVARDESEEQGPSTRQLCTMRRMDGQAQALFRLLILPIKSALRTASFVPAEDGEEEADFIEKVFTMAPQQGGMTVTFQRFMGQLLLSLFDGFAAFEKVFWMPIKGPMAGKITLKKLAYRPPETITFITDKNGGFAGLRQRIQKAGQFRDVYIDPDYAFYYAAQEEQRKFYGVSFFQAAFYHYDKKVKLYYTAHLAAQRAAVGTRVGTVPPNASMGAKREFQSALNNLAFAQFMMVPEGFKVEILREAGSFDFLNLINHHNNQMSKSILAGFFDKETGAGKGEGSLVNFAQPGDDMFILMLRSIMDEIANQINHYIIPQLIDLNFQGGKYPEFTWGKLTDEQKAAISATFDKLASAQTITPEFMRALEQNQAEEFGLDIDYEEVEEREAQEAEMARQGLTPDGQPLDPNAGMPGMLPGGTEPGEADLDPAEAPPSDNPDTWNETADFEEALGFPREGSEEPDEEEVELTEEQSILALAHSIVTAALEEEMARA